MAARPRVDPRRAADQPDPPQRVVRLGRRHVGQGRPARSLRDDMGRRHPRLGDRPLRPGALQAPHRRRSEPVPSPRSARRRSCRRAPTDPFALPTVDVQAALRRRRGVGDAHRHARQAVATASQAERDTVWQDDALLATMRRQFPLDDYLALLPQLRVLMPGKGKKPVDQWGTYDSATLGPEVDRVITTELGHYVGGGRHCRTPRRGRGVGRRVTTTGSWRSSGSGRSRSCSQHMATANAFVDVNQPARHIWIHKDRGGAGTAIHEGFHKYASPVLRDTLIDDFRGGGNDVCNLDEGLTEYFTRTVITSAGLGFPRSSYPSQFKSVTKLLTKISEATLAKAYFDGDMANAAGGVPHEGQAQLRRLRQGARGQRLHHRRRDAVSRRARR